MSKIINKKEINIFLKSVMKHRNTSRTKVPIAGDFEPKERILNLLQLLYLTIYPDGNIDPFFS